MRSMMGESAYRAVWSCKTAQITERDESLGGGALFLSVARLMREVVGGGIIPA